MTIVNNIPSINLLNIATCTAPIDAGPSMFLAMYIQNSATDVMTAHTPNAAIIAVIKTVGLLLLFYFHTRVVL